MSHPGGRYSLDPMYRNGGLFFLALGAVFVYFLAFTPFDEPVRRWTRPEEGSGFVQIKIECPDAWSALVLGDRVDSHSRTDRDQCVRAARTHATGALIVAIVGAVVGLRSILRGPAPEPLPLRPLSELIHRRGRSTEDPSHPNWADDSRM